MTIATAAAGNSWINKVPEATLLFWIIKMMSTTVGETGADYLAADLHFGLAGTALVTGLLLAGAWLFQLRASRYMPPLYWICVVLVSIFGTLVTDMLSDLAGVPLAISTAAFSIAMLATFWAWHAREKTLSIAAIDSPRRELFYWTVILFTFALGTAAGDWVAEGLNLGYANSALLFGGLIGLVALARYGFKLNATACFWIAYVLTRPFGASCGDLLSQPGSSGGLGFGTIATSALFLAVIAGLVAYLSFTQKRLTAQRA